MFLAQNGDVIWVTAGGPYTLKPDEIIAFLGIFDREHAVKPWLELDEAAQAAGYPPAITSMKWEAA